jgi:hypothetical protein
MTPVGMVVEAFVELAIVCHGGNQPWQVAAAVQAAARTLEDHQWQILGQLPSPIRGANGAAEAFLHAVSMSPAT